MKKFSCDRYFPKQLEFTESEKAQYLRLVQDLVQETLDEYSEYRTVPYDANSTAPMSTSVLDPLEWKEVSRSGGLTIYKDRKKQGEKKAKHQTLRKPGDGFDVVESKWPIPMMLMLGHIRGRLHDTMYGAFVDSDDGFRLRTSYLHDDLDDIKILHKFEGASLEDPFRFCGIVWYVYGQKLGSIMRRRDSVLLVAMGMTTSNEGDRIGYNIMHSVDVPELRPLTQYKIQRAYGSIVFVKRQLDDQRVELFQKGFFTPMGDIPEFAIVNTLMRGMLRAGNSTIDVSLSKKLYWMMQDATRARTQSSKLSDPVAGDEARPCAGRCKSKLSASSTRGTCMICRKVCGLQAHVGVSVCVCKVECALTSWSAERITARVLGLQSRSQNHSGGYRRERAAENVLLLLAVRDDRAQHERVDDRDARVFRAGLPVDAVVVQVHALRSVLGRSVAHRSECVFVAREQQRDTENACALASRMSIHSNRVSIYEQEEIRVP